MVYDMIWNLLIRSQVRYPITPADHVFLHEHKRKNGLAANLADF
jgi:hypothetical protein